MSTAIQWTDETWNPVTGCTKVSPGCAHCYMYRQYPRLAGMRVPGYKDGTADMVRTWPERLDQPRRWRKPRRVFVCSMADLFHRDVPAQFIEDVVARMRAAPQHTFQVLTKRHERLFTLSPRLRWPSNVWVGVSVENQHWLEERLWLFPHVEAAVRFLSVEPMLGPVSLRQIPYRLWQGRVNWLIAGGESGPRARPMRPEWVRSLRDECRDFGIPFFFKQWGGRTPKAGGRLLDGVEHSAFPLVRGG